MEWYKLTQKEVLDKLKSSPQGLSSIEVKRRQYAFGKNVIHIEKPPSLLRVFIQQFKSYLIWLLIVLAIFAFFIYIYFHRMEQLFDGIIISIIVLINTLLGAYQDYTAEKSAQLLRSMLRNESTAIRDSVKTKIDSSELVAGDIIFLSEGDKIPADCRILEADELHVDESILTGESMNVVKTDAPLKKTAPLAERKNMVYMNTFVTRGEAKCVVVATGANTEVGKIAASFKQKRRYPFLDEVDTAAKKITYVAFVMVIFLSLIFIARGYSWISVFMISSALIIGSVPEGLPAIVTFALAMGSRRLAEKKILIKSKSLLETLGSVDVVCTDKTGTLTENKMKVKRVFIDGQSVKSVKEASEETFSHFMNCSLLANEAKDTDKGFVGDSEDIALINLANELKVDILKLKGSCPAEKFEPFSSETKRVSSYNAVGDALIKYTKGAPEVVINACTHMLKGGRVVRLSDKEKKKLFDIVRRFSDDALRVLAFSYKEIKEEDTPEVFIALIGLYDKPREGIAESVSVLYRASISIKMITGDSEKTAEAIAKECGFRDVKAISWDRLKDMSEDELNSVVEEYNVFARMSPEFKLRIVNALQNNGHRVAITGDGVNDVPSLRQADVGVAMGGRGSDIAKEASDLILLEDNLPSIVDGVKEGRRIFSNVRKVINYLLTANLAEVLVVFFGSLAGVMPFLAIQILWTNFVTDVAPALSFGIDPPHKDIMKRKPTGKSEKIINKRIVLLTVFIGVKKVVLMLAIFFIAYHFTGNLLIAQTMSFTWLVFSHFVRVAAIRFDEGINMFINRTLNWSVTIPVILQLIIIYTPLSKFFHVVRLSGFEWIVIILSFLLAIFLARIITLIIAKMDSEIDF